MLQNTFIFNTGQFDDFPALKQLKKKTRLFHASCALAERQKTECRQGKNECDKHVNVISVCSFMQPHLRKTDVLPMLSWARWANKGLRAAEESRCMWSSSGRECGIKMLNL